jgi:serine/threonine-protein kinase
LVSADLAGQLQTTLGDAYAIERELGGGGMSRVFTAVETALGRRVVIKVLAPDLAAGVSAQRFAREIRLAASLQQANIVPVLSVGDTNGLPYYTMPFVEGLSLRDRLARDGRLPIARAVSVLRDVARALAYAHESGVVHRDIKPHNILLSGEAAVVTDFGIARALTRARSETSVQNSEVTITELGTTLGTPAYMAPEQIAADPNADHRADLYSFGCVAYEMLSGETPFAGRSAPQLLAAQLGERPTPLGEKCPDCPPAIVTLVMQCLEKEPAARPPSAQEILQRLETTTAPATGLERLTNRLTRRQRRSVLGATGIVLIAVLAVPAQFRLRDGAGTDRVESLAVIPFLNVGGDTTQEYLAEGMANELTTALGKVAGIRVVSRTLSARYRDRSDLDAQDIGQTLAVRYVLHGTVRRTADQLTVSAQLISATDNSEAWSEDFRGSASDAFAIQDSITRAIGHTLQRRLGGAVASSGVSPRASIGTTNADAYDLYLRGKLQLERRGAGVTQAIGRFEQAIAQDSNFARPYAGLAVALALIPYFTPTPAVTVRDSTIRTAQRALAFDSTQAEAYTALGLAYQGGYDWARALAAHRRAIALDSNDASARVQYARLLFHLRQLALSSAEFDRARRLDPYSSVASAWAGHLMSLTGRNAEAIAELERALEIDSLNPPGQYMLAQALLKAGDRDSAKAVVTRLVRIFPAWRKPAGVLYGLLGDHAAAGAMLRELEVEEPVVGGRFSTIVMIALALRDTSRALDALTRATDEREPWPVWGALSDHHFDPLIGSARYTALLRRVGLDERVFNPSTGGGPR